MAEIRAGADEVAANRDLWTQANSEYAEGHAGRAWAAEDIAWGIFNLPEQQLGVLGDVRGLDVVELGCGTAYFSAWLARRGAWPTEVDVTSAQLASARRCQDRFGISFRSSRPTPEMSRCRQPASTWPSPNAAPACGATRPAG